MPITQAQRELRRNYIGASDVPAILGADPWRSSADVWASKVFELRDDAPSEAAAAGTLLEPAIMAWAEEQLNKPITRDVFNAVPPFCANHDGLIIIGDKRAEEGVEAKTSGIVGQYVDEQWGEAGTDEVPTHVYLQCQAQMMVSDLELVWVPALIGRRGFVMHRVPRAPDIIARIVETGHEFWNKWVLTKTPPPDSQPHLDILKKIRPTGKVISIGQEVIDHWQAARAARLLAEKEEEKHEAAVRLIMGDAHKGVCQNGTVEIKKIETKRIDIRLLRVEYPNLVPDLETVSESFRMGYKANKPDKGPEERAWNQ